MHIREHSITLPLTTQLIDEQPAQVFVRHWQPAHITHAAPLVLLHDSLGSVGQWKTFPEQLANAIQREVIAYDRLGFGQSSARNTLPSLAFITEEATHYFPHIKQQLGLTQYALLGHSVGGGMAMNIAARDRDCQQVITLAAQAHVEPKTRQGIRDTQAYFLKDNNLSRLAKWHGDKARWVLDAWTSTWLADGFTSWSLADCIEDVTCPALVMHGEHDEYGSRAFPEFIAQHIATPCTPHLLANCGHMPHKEHPALIIDHVKQFLGGF